MLGIGRCLMTKPKLILMDETSTGMATLLYTHIFQKITEIHKQDTTILLVEQNADAALRISSRAYVIETGKVVLQGMSKELLHNHEVRRAYLGREYEEVWE